MGIARIDNAVDKATGNLPKPKPTPRKKRGIMQGDKTGSNPSTIKRKTPAQSRAALLAARKRQAARANAIKAKQKKAK